MPSIESTTETQTFIPAGAGHDPQVIDAHVGARVRLRRKSRGMSQAALADSLGVTFQQIQKYELGSNRVSASKLWAIASALEAPVTYFYEGLEATAVAAPGEEHAAQRFLATFEGLQLATAFVRAPRPLQRSLLKLLEEASRPDPSASPAN